MYAVGVVFIAFGSSEPRQAADSARAHGFAHIDVPTTWSTDAAELGIPIGDRISTTAPEADATWAPMGRRLEGENVVDLMRRNPTTRLETIPGGPAATVERARALADQVTGLRLTVDTGHLAARGEDPVELLDLAAHVQLRQAARGQPQMHIDEGGDVDFAAVLRRLDALDYRGLLSVEYFDLPELGFPLADPVNCAVDLARHIRSLAP